MESVCDVFVLLMLLMVIIGSFVFVVSCVRVCNFCGGLKVVLLGVVKIGLKRM